MTVHLDEAGSARLDHGQLEIELTVHSGGAAILYLTASDTTTPPPSRRLQPTRLLAPVVQSRTTVEVRSADAYFPDGSIVQLTIRTSRDGRVSQVVGPKVDLSALEGARLAEIEPLDEHFITVKALAVDYVRPSNELTPVTRAVQFAARRLKESGQLPRAKGGLVLCIDRSASMTPHIQSGLVQTIVEAVLGVDRGLGDGGEVPVFAVGTEPLEIEPLTDANSADYVKAHSAGLQPTTGFMPSALACIRAPGDREGTVVILTDDIPMDADECIRVWNGRARWHVALIGRPTSQTLAIRVGLPFGEVDPFLTADALTTGVGHEDRALRLVSALVGSSTIDRRDR